MTAPERPRVWLNPAALETIRQCRGLTPTQLGRKAGVGAGTIRNLELGIRRPSMPMVAKLATALGVRWDALAVNLDDIPQLVPAGRGAGDDDASE